MTRPYRVDRTATGWRVVAAGQPLRLHRTRARARAHIANLRERGWTPAHVFAIRDAARKALANLDQLTEASRSADKPALMAPQVGKLATAVRKVFRLQRRLLLRDLAAIRDRFPEPTAESRTQLRESLEADWGAIWEGVVAATTDDFGEVLSDSTMAALASGAQAMLGSLGMQRTFDLADPRAADWLSEHGAGLVSGINDTTRDAIRRVIADGVSEGKSYAKIAGQLRGMFDNWAEPQGHIRDRAEMIAVTELHYGYEAGSRVVIDGLRAAGVSIEKSWLTNGEHPCPDCEGNEGDGWILLAEDHSSGDQQPPQHPGCRCTEEYRRIGADGEEDTTISADEGDGGG